MGEALFGTTAILPAKGDQSPDKIHYPMKEKAVLAESKKPSADVSLPPEVLALCKPVGTFAGTDDLILRVRNGQVVAADSGDQGNGQN